MIYKVFGSTLDSVEKIMKYKDYAHALDIKYYTEFREIEAKSKSEAKRKFIEQYKDLLDEFSDKPINFFFVDNDGSICS